MPGRECVVVFKVFIVLINNWISAFSGFLFCGSAAIANVNMFLSPVLNASLFLAFHRFHACLDFCIFWICFVRRWPEPS